MSDSSTELLQMAEIMDQLAARGRQEEIQQPLARLKESAEEIGKAWSGAWFGYHANVYYKDLRPPPPGAHFSQEWGFMRVEFHGTTGHWVEFNAEDVKRAIHECGGNPDMGPAHTFNDEASKEFQALQMKLASILEIEMDGSDSLFLAQLKEKVDRLAVMTEREFIDRWKPERIMTRDSIAISQGCWIPPHVAVLSQVEAILQTIYTVTKFVELLRQAESHISRKGRKQVDSEAIGRNVFIGHGRSPIWLELENFLQSRLKLTVDEFNRIPTAGKTNVQRLSEMMDSAAFAFIVLTGEDEQSSGELHARLNVVHEAGLFQGRLGFEHAIILIEEGCEEFSNIDGLGQIRFPKDRIDFVFEKVREVLEDRGVFRLSG